MYERELEVALEAAALAGRFLVDEYQRFAAIPDARADITTEADRQSQEIILTYLRRHFPQDALCAEEATPTLEQTPRTGDRLWIVDPIDGTRGFAKKNGEFSIMIGFVNEDRIGAGVVQQPAVGRVTFARAGGGCWRRDGVEAVQPCRVTDVSALQRATLTQSRSRNPDVRSPLVTALNPGRIVESYSAGIKLALVARGEADLYLNTYDAFHDWDICAGHLLVTEAGGHVTGIKGEELRYGLPGAWQRAGLLASNCKLHAAAVNITT